MKGGVGCDIIMGRDGKEEGGKRGRREGKGREGKDRGRGVW